MIKTKNRGLGRGLDLIFRENSLDLNKENEILTVRISDVEPNKKQPRINFNEELIAELAQSISVKGVLQPILVRSIEDGRYQIIAGERRWRASRMAGLSEIPVIVKDLNEEEAMEIALIENLQRQDLSPIEEAKGYKVLMEKYSLTQEEVSQSVGKSRSSVANSLRLLNLPKKAYELLDAGEMTAGHAKALLSLTRKVDLDFLIDKIRREGISVRQTEKIVKNMLSKGKQSKAVETKREVIFDEIEISLKERLGRSVKIKENKGKQGFLQIPFYSEEDLINLVKHF